VEISSRSRQSGAKSVDHLSAFEDPYSSTATGANSEDEGDGDKFVSPKSAPRRGHHRRISDLGLSRVFREPGGDLKHLKVPASIHKVMESVQTKQDNTGWKLSHLTNGLRIFEEDKTETEIPCMKACGLVSASASDIFKLMMDLSASRTQWDLPFSAGKVLSSESRHADVVHLETRSFNTFPMYTNARDFVLSRHWKHESDGSYTIVLASVTHAQCPPSKKFIRGNMEGSCVRITPMQNEEHHQMAYVEFAVTVDPKVSSFGSKMGCSLWLSVAVLLGSLLYAVSPATAAVVLFAFLLFLFAVRTVLFNVLGSDFWSKLYRGYHRQYAHQLLLSVAGLRDMISQTPELESFIYNTGVVYQLDKNAELFTTVEDHPPSGGVNSDGSASDDEFDELEKTRMRKANSPKPPSNTKLSQMQQAPSSSAIATTATTAVANRSSPTALQSASPNSDLKFTAGEMDAATVASIQTQFESDIVPELRALSAEHCTMKEATTKDNMDDENCWAVRDADGFNVRGPNYLTDKVKTRAEKSLMHLVGFDCVAHDQEAPISHIASHPANFVKKAAQSELNTKGDLAPFFFIVNFQVPGAPQYATVFYFAQPRGIIGKTREQRVLMNFIEGDQQYRDSRLKLIPCVAEGNWIVKRGVGSTPAILGKKLAITYHRGANYFEIDIDVGVSSMAGAIVKLVTGPAKSLVIDLAFLIEAQTEEELPEEVVGAIRLQHIDLAAINLMKTPYA